MAYTIKTKLANKENYGSKRDLKKIKYIVIHYTANDGDTDENNGKYFANNIVKASAHYFVDDDSVTRSVPDNYIAYHCGAKIYKHLSCRNTNSIGIEICDDVRNGKIYPSAKTIQNALELTKELMKKYNIPASKVIRHYDVTGKSCPAYWCGTTAKNKKWKTEFHNKLTEAKKTTSKEYKVKVTAGSLNVRAGAGTKYSVVAVAKKGDTLTITEEQRNGLTKWGKVKKPAGWVSLGYTKKL